MALVNYSLSFVFLISLLYLAFCNSIRVQNSLCFLERYIEFNVEKPNKPALWHQSNMIQQFTNYMMLRGITCGLQQSSGSSYCGQICAPLAYSSTRLWLQSQTVRQQCQRPLCSRSSWFSRSHTPPCGAISFHSNLTERSQWTLTLPKYLEFNFTIWKVVSKSYPLGKAKCKTVPNLALWDMHSLGTSHLRSRLCGNTPIQNIVSAAQTVTVVWNSSVPYEERASFCLSYQPTAAGYTRQYSAIYTWLKFVKYFKDEFIDRDFNIKKGSMMRLLNMQNSEILARFFKRFSTYIITPHSHYRFFTGGVISRVWSITGSIYYVPQLILVNFSCTADNSNSIKRPTLEIFDHPLTQYDPIWLIHPYIIGPPITCNTTVASLLYNSSIGDLTIQLTTTVTDDTHIFGRIRYSALSCPSTYCAKTAKNVSVSKRSAFSLTSHSGKKQQRLLIEMSNQESGFIAISNFSVSIHGSTHVPCYYGGLFIYELEPLTLVAKICTPWVAKAWHNAVKRVNGTQGLSFNTRPMLFVIKSYGQKFSVHMDGYATMSQCSGVVNAAFRDMHSAMKVSQNGEIKWLPQNRLLVKHTRGCFQLSHVLTDDNYLARDQTTQLTMFAVGDSSSNLANHTVEASLTGDIEESLNTKIVRPTYHKPTEVYYVEEMANGELPCGIGPVGIGLSDFKRFYFNTSFFISLLPGRRSYSVLFLAQCLMYGINPVVTMKYMPRVVHLCPGPAEMKRQIRMFSENLDGNMVTFPSLICGNFQALYTTPKQYIKTHIFFNKPSFKPFCCVLDLDVYLPILQLPLLDSLVIEEHDWEEAGSMLSSSIFGIRGQSSRTDIIASLLAFETFHMDRIWTYIRSRILRTSIIWTFSSSSFSNILGNVSNLFQNSSINVRVTGRAWSVNILHVECAHIVTEFSSNDTFYPGMNISFRFKEWHSVAIPPVTKRGTRNRFWNLVQTSSWNRNHSYCYTEYGICYDFYETDISSWFEGEQFCRFEGKVLLSTPTDYEWKIIAALFAREPVIVNLINNYLAFINLRNNKVRFPEILHVCICIDKCQVCYL